MSSKHLERALIFTLLAHAGACAAMGLLLMPGIPGGPNTDPLMRAAFIAAHPTLWRIGFGVWHITSLSDVLLSLALVGASWQVARKPALLALFFTLVALGIEQPCEILWETRMVDLARDAVASGSAADFTQLETPLYLWLAAASTLAWTVTAVCWSWSLARIGIWQRGLTACSIVLWGLFALISLTPLAPRWPWLGAAVIIGNALGFALMLAWFAWVTYIVFKQNRLPLSGKSSP